MSMKETVYEKRSPKLQPAQILKHKIENIINAKN